MSVRVSVRRFNPTRPWTGEARRHIDVPYNTQGNTPPRADEFQADFLDNGTSHTLRDTSTGKSRRDLSKATLSAVCPQHFLEKIGSEVQPRAVWHLCLAYSTVDNHASRFRIIHSNGTGTLFLRGNASFHHTPRQKKRDHFPSG